MCTVDNQKQAMTVAEFAASNGMMLLPLSIELARDASMWDAVLRASYPTFEVKIGSPVDFSSGDPDELLRDFKFRDMLSRVVEH